MSGLFDCMWEKIYLEIHILRYEFIIVRYLDGKRRVRKLHNIFFRQ